MRVILERNITYVLAALFAASLPVQAEEPEEAIARCAKIATVGDRILCLETALRQYADTEPEIAADAYPSQLEPEVGVAPQGEAATTAPQPAPESEPTVSATAAAPVPTAEPESVPAAGATTVDLGAEQVTERDKVESKEKQRIQAAIVDHEVVGYGRLRLTLDNGQVWQQTTDDDRNTERFLRGDDEVPIEMWQSRSGGYRMHLIPFNRTLRVKRLK